MTQLYQHISSVILEPMKRIQMVCRHPAKHTMNIHSTKSKTFFGYLFSPHKVWVKDVNFINILWAPMWCWIFFWRILFWANRPKYNNQQLFIRNNLNYVVKYQHRFWWIIMLTFLLCAIYISSLVKLRWGCAKLLSMSKYLSGNILLGTVKRWEDDDKVKLLKSKYWTEERVR